MDRRAVVLLGLGWGLVAPVWAQARDTPMREAADLRQAYRLASPRLPFVLLVSIRGCPFCEFVRRSYLLPMNQEGSINAWQLPVDQASPLRGFAGEALNRRAFAQAQGARTTPTLLFLDDQGKALAEPLVGVVSSEFYGAVLDERLTAVQKSAR